MRNVIFIFKKSFTVFYFCKSGNIVSIRKSAAKYASKHTPNVKKMNNTKTFLFL